MSEESMTDKSSNEEEPVVKLQTSIRSFFRNKQGTDDTFHEPEGVLPHVGCSHTPYCAIAPSTSAASASARLASASRVLLWSVGIVSSTASWRSETTA